MDAEIGSIIEINGVKLRVEEDDGFSCACCSGLDDEICIRAPDCSRSFREDGRDVIFKKVDDNETS